ncbi:hypothetical protein [Burkholderia cenocepacia]|uniref:hypothetical protein n=1 Tax=Burkholderia cenocepacia TaxID=95486 RepID=UPI002ABE95F1|nr:hypothetical protein [Burkholderia cenocepacia]
MAEAKKLTLAEILAKRKEFEDMVAAQMEAERPAALTAVLEQIKLFNFTAEELGLKVESAGKAAGGKGAGAGGTRNITKPLKSKSGEVGVWLAHPPKFLETEGAFTTYKSGKSVDGWLADPVDKKAKLNFLRKLSSREGKVPTKDQLGDITEAEFKAA